jgi:hypothetical protein
MSRLAIIAVALGGLAHGSPGIGQACDSDCVAILGVALEWAAAEFNTPFAEIAVDTVRGGFAASRGRGLALRRIIGPGDLARLRSTRGVMLRGFDDFFDCRPRPPRHVCGTALVAFTALLVEGDSATLLVRIQTRPSDERPHGRKAMHQVYLSKTGSGWRLDRAVQTSW